MLENFNTSAATYFEQGHACGYMDGYTQGQLDNADTLTKPELDFLVSVISGEINTSEGIISATKESKEYFYNLCDKNDPSAEAYYWYYLANRRYLKTLVKRRNKLAIIQAKLKKMR